MCSRGLHLTTKPENWLKVGCRIFRAQADAEPTRWDGDKCVVSGARLLYPIRKPAYWTRVEEFVASIKTVPFFRPDGNPDPEWKLFTADNWDAARSAAWDAARDAARGAAWDAAWYAAWDAAWDAAWNAARSAAWSAARDAAWYAARDAARDAAWYAARDAARDAAWYAARDAVRDAARSAAWSAAWNAARDAKLMAGLSVCDGLQLAENHAEHIRARWRIWQKGYAPLCDVNGVFYVYSAKERP